MHPNDENRKYRLQYRAIALQEQGIYIVPQNKYIILNYEAWHAAGHPFFCE
jgi:hypothetical protein